MTSILNYYIKMGMAGKMKILYLHIGYHKTGTSSIQKSLVNSLEVLRNHNFSYFCEGLQGKITSNTNSWIKYDEERILGGKGASVINVEQLFKKLSLLEGNVIMSSEHFSWIQEDNEIKKIYKEAQYYFDKIKIVIYLRRQDKLAISHHQQGSGYTRKGHRVPASFVYGYENRALPVNNPMVRNYLDYYRKISMWASFFGKENILIRIFEKNKLVGQDVVTDFFSVLGITSGFKKFRINQSKGFERIKIGHSLIKCNLPPGPINRMIRAKSSRKGRFLPSRSEAMHFYNFYLESNRKLNLSYNISQKNDCIFDPDFSSYSEEPRDVWAEDSANVAILNIFKAIKPLTHLQTKDLILAAYALKDIDVDAYNRLKEVIRYFKDFESPKNLKEIEIIEAEMSKEK